MNLYGGEMESWRHIVGGPLDIYIYIYNTIVCHLYGHWSSEWDAIGTHEINHYGWIKRDLFEGKKKKTPVVQSII